MRTHLVRVAACAALVILLASAAAMATTRGIEITEARLVNQEGMFRFRDSLGFQIVCAVTLDKTLIVGLVPVRVPLTKIGKVTSGQFAGFCPELTFLNLPRALFGRPAPGPNAESWDITFLSSDLATGDMYFGILDVQIQVTYEAMRICLYRGTLLGVLSADGTTLRYGSTLRIAGGIGMCLPELSVEGQFNNEPPIRYRLLDF
jgi:hypothetical protein